MTSQHDLTLGALSLVHPVPGVRFTVSVLADADFGESDPEVVEAASFLADGALESIDRFGNREPSFQVLAKVTKGGTSDDLAAAEAALMAECGKRNELIFTPSDGQGEPAVFDVMTSWLDFDFNDLEELRTERTYVLTLRVLPFTRSTRNAVVVGPFAGSGATPATPTETMVWQPADGLTGWSAQWTSREFGSSDVTRFGNPDFADNGVLGKAVDVGSTANLRSIGLNFTMTPTGTTPVQYVRVDWGAWQGAATLDGPLRLDLTLADDSTATASIAVQDSSGAYFGPFTGITSGDVAEISLLRRYDWGSRRSRFYVHSLSFFDMWPFQSGTAGSQQSITLGVEGTARTEASIYVGHDVSALGDVLVWTGQQLGGYAPPLTPHRTAGGAPVDSSTRLSGSSRPLNGATPETSEVSVQNLPEGSYNLYALLRADVAGGQTITWTAATVLGGNALSTQTGTAFLELTTDYQVYPIGRVVLPTVRAQSDALVRLTLKSSGAAHVDEWWSFFGGNPLDKTKTGALSHIKCGTGTPASGGSSSRLWLDTASVANPTPSIWLGSELDKSDARHANALTESLLAGTHTFAPGPLAVFVASTNASNVAVQMEHELRWHTYPRRVDAGPRTEVVRAVASVSRISLTDPDIQSTTGIDVEPDLMEALVRFEIPGAPFADYAVTSASLTLTRESGVNDGTISAYLSGNDWTATDKDLEPGTWDTEPVVGALMGSAVASEGGVLIPMGAVSGSVVSFRLRADSGRRRFFDATSANPPVLAITYEFAG